MTHTSKACEEIYTTVDSEMLAQFNFLAQYDVDIMVKTKQVAVQAPPASTYDINTPFKGNSDDAQGSNIIIAEEASDTVLTSAKPVHNINNKKNEKVYERIYNNDIPMSEEKNENEIKYLYDSFTPVEDHVIYLPGTEAGIKYMHKLNDYYKNSGKIGAMAERQFDDIPSGIMVDWDVLQSLPHPQITMGQKKRLAQAVAKSITACFNFGENGKDLSIVSVRRDREYDSQGGEKKEILTRVDSTNQWKDGFHYLIPEIQIGKQEKIFFLSKLMESIDVKSIFASCALDSFDILDVMSSVVPVFSYYCSKPGKQTYHKIESVWSFDTDLGDSSLVDSKISNRANLMAELAIYTWGCEKIMCKETGVFNADTEEQFQEWVDNRKALALVRKNNDDKYKPKQREIDQVHSDPKYTDYFFRCINYGIKKLNQTYRNETKPWLTVLALLKSLQKTYGVDKTRMVQIADEVSSNADNGKYMGYTDVANAYDRVKPHGQWLFLRWLLNDNPTAQKEYCKVWNLCFPKILELDYYSDYKNLINETVTVKTITSWIDNSLVLIRNGGDANVLTKNKQYDRLADEMSTSYKNISIDKLMTSLRRKCYVLNPKYDAEVAKTYANTDKKKIPVEYRSVVNKTISTHIGFSGADGVSYLKNVFEEETLPAYDQVEFHPYLKRMGEPNMHGNFNIFTGFPLEDKEITQEINFEDSHLYRHLKEEFFNNDPGELTHFLDHITDMIQCPAEIRSTAHLFYSDPGCGKGLLYKFMTKLLGTAHAMSFENVDDYFKQFNADHANKLLKVFEELAEKGTVHSNYNRVKADISKETIRIEPKCIDPYPIRNSAKLWFFTNNAGGFYVEGKNRRLTMHKISNKYANNKERFKPIAAEINDKQFCINAFKYFSTREYDVDNTMRVYETAYRKEQKVVSLPTGIKFIKSIFEDDDITVRCDEDGNVSTKVLHQAYSSWCNENGSTYRLSTLKTQIAKINICQSEKKVTMFKGMDRQQRCKAYNLDVNRLEKEFANYLNMPDFKFNID